MARDLNRLMDNLRNSREVVVTADGQIEDVAEARDNQAREMARDGSPQGRLTLKDETFAFGA